MTQRHGLASSRERTVRVDRAIEQLDRLAREPRFELLVRVRPRATPATTDPDLFTRARARARTRPGVAAGAARVRALWVECRTREAQEQLRAFPQRPHLIVRAGATLHAAWQLDEPITDPRQARHASRRLAEQFGRGVSGVQAPERVPVPGSADWRTT